MAIINTLLTAKDQMSDTIIKAKDNVKKSTGEIKKGLDGASESADRFNGAMDAANDLDFSSFSSAINSIKNIRTQMDAAAEGAGRFLVSAGLLVGGLTAVGTVLVGVVNSSSEYVNELNKIATSTGTTIERLQQMQSVFRDTNLEVEKFGDINKDALDHLGDAFRDGSGPADDMKAYGLNLKEYNKYLNQTNGGLNAVIHTFYKMKEAGKSQAEITNMMETLASDSSHLVTVLQKLGTEQEALNALQNSHVGITEESAKAYQEYQRSIEELSTTFQNWKANALTPTVNELNTILDILNGNWEGTNFTEWANKFMFNGDNIISQGLRSMGNLSPVDYDTKENRALNSLASNALSDSQELTKGAPSGGFEKPGKDNSAAIAKKLAAEKQAASQYLKQLDVNNATELSKAEMNYNEQLKKLDGFLSKKLIKQQDYEHGVQAINSQLQTAQIDASEKNELASLENKNSRKLLTEEDYQKKKNDIETRYNAQRIDSQFTIEMERLDYLHSQKIVKEEDYLNQVASLNQKHQYDINKNTATGADINKNIDYAKQTKDLQTFTNNMNQGITIASQFTQAIAASQEQGSAAWYAATIATKAMAVAQAIMMANLVAVQTAAYTPGPAGIAAGEAARAWGYASAGMIAATGIMEIAGARESGGQVQAGKNYLVGEKGPEIFTAGATGQITTNGKSMDAMNGGNNTFNQYNNFEPASDHTALLNQIKSATESMIDSKLVTEKRNNGRLSFNQ